jgi:hypothetical protein
MPERQPKAAMELLRLCNKTAGDGDRDAKPAGSHRVAAGGLGTHHHSNVTAIVAGVYRTARSAYQGAEPRRISALDIH